MSDLLKQVLHHLEGEESETQNWQTADGTKVIKTKTFGPDRWIERAALGRLMAIDCLAVILFSVRDTFDLEKERAIVDAWAAELRRAAVSGEIQARDPDTLLQLAKVPHGWEWLLSTEDADKFIVARGMSWTCSEQIAYLLDQSRDAGTTYRDAETGQVVRQLWLAGHEPKPSAPNNAAAVPQAQADDKPKTHKLRNKVPVLDAEINLAKTTAIDPADPNSVWAELVKLAEKKTGCLLGPDGKDAIKYQSGEEVKFFKKRSLRERMGRMTTY